MDPKPYNSFPDWMLDVTLFEIQKSIAQLDSKLTFVINVLLKPDIKFRYVDDNISISTSSNLNTTFSIDNSFLKPCPLKVRICWYHQRYGALATKCQPPCTFNEN